MKDESVEAGVRLINDEENEDEFNVILRQQSAEDESSFKSIKQSSTTKDDYKNNHSHYNAHKHHNNRHHNRNKQQQSHHHSKNHATNQAIHRKQRNQLCRKLKCRFGSICKLDQADLNSVSNHTKIDNQSNLKSKLKSDEDTKELNRISLEVTAYCDCSHINCELTDKDKESEELCGSDGLFYSACQMKEKSCKFQTNIQIKQRSFCDSNVNKVNKSTQPGKIFC